MRVWRVGSPAPALGPTAGLLRLAPLEFQQTCDSVCGSGGETGHNRKRLRTLRRNMALLIPTLWVRFGAVLLVMFAAVAIVREARASTPYRAYLVQVSGQTFGFIDIPAEYQSPVSFQIPVKDITILHLGPFGMYDVPLTATQGLVGFCIFLVVIVAMPIILLARYWRGAERKSSECF